MLNFLILKSIFVDYLKLLYGLKHNLHIISRKKIEFEIIETDLQAAKFIKWLVYRYFSELLKTSVFFIMYIFWLNQGVQWQNLSAKKVPEINITKHAKIIPNQTNLRIINHDLFWSLKVPWVMFMATMKIVFITNWVNMGIWAKTLIP